MKFLFWTDGFWPRIGGIETQATQFVEGMYKRGHEGLVVAHKDYPNWEDHETYQDISIRRFDFNTIIPNRELNKLRPIQNYLEWIAREFQPDIIHLNACAGWILFIFLLFKKMFSAPLVLTIHSPFFYKNETNPLLGKISLQADQICCVSNWVLGETEKLIPASKSKLRRIYNGLLMPEIVPSSLSFSPPVFLLAGRFTLEKGFETAIRAFSLLKPSKAQLLIIGEGEDRPSMENLVGQLGLKNSVRFTGGMPKNEVPVFIDRATVVIVPSYFESFGLVALEAMQMGRPVIASAVGGLQEIISHGETGLLVPPKDSIALSEAMQKLLDQPQVAIEMGARGRKRAIENFTLHQNIDQYETLYRELIGKNSL